MMNESDMDNRIGELFAKLASSLTSTELDELLSWKETRKINASKIGDFLTEAKLLSYDQVVKLRQYAIGVQFLLNNLAFPCEGMSNENKCHRDRSTKLHYCKECEKGMCSICFIHGSKYDTKPNSCCILKPFHCEHKNICAECCSEDHNKTGFAPTGAVELSSTASSGRSFTSAPY